MATRSRGPGRPPHEPTEDARGLVVAMVGRGDPVADIAAAVGISEPTLLRHYEAELAAPGPQAALSLLGEAAPREPRQSAGRGGRPGHVPTRQRRERVEVLVAGGQTQWQIAVALGITVPTLVLHYAEELDAGRARQDAQIIEALFEAAKGGNVAAMKAWLARDRGLHAPMRALAGETDTAPGGKKAAAQAAALTAQTGTDWADLLPN